jgi:hypothetical protein
MTVKVLPLWDKSLPKLREEGWTVISTVSKSEGWSRGLSPFVLGPCPVMNGVYKSLNMENAWQYSKVYKEHIGKTGWPNEKWWKWAKEGWSNPKAIRYPMGKGVQPKYALWCDEDGHFHKLDYIQARKMIYCPLYHDAVEKTSAYKQLMRIYRAEKKVVLLDYDAYDHEALKLRLGNVLHQPLRKMGHAFVLAMMITRDPAMEFFGTM